MPVSGAYRSDFRRIAVTALIAIALVLSGALALVAWSAAAIDRAEARKEIELVQRRIVRLKERQVDDLNSATVWNDAVVATNGTLDRPWLQVNFGDYFADYMDHAVTLTYAGSGAPMMASRDSEPVPLGNEAGLIAAVAGIVETVRTAGATPEKREAVGFEAVVNRTGLVRVGDQTWIVAASTVVPEDTTVARPTADAIVISARPISALLTSMTADLGIKAPAFQQTEPRGLSLPVTGPAGERIGWLSWTPDRPGWSLLREAMPWLAALLAALAFAAIALARWTDHVGRRLADNEAALTEARDRAEAANVAKSRFLGNMSHELRTPLNGVIGMAEIMAMGDLSDIQRAHLKILRGSGEDLLKMIEHLLHITTLERGDSVITHAVFDPLDTVKAAISARSDAARNKGLSLDLSFVDLGPRIGDAAHLEQALYYLIDNAIAYTPTGGIRVDVSDNGSLTTFSVSDTGIGIDPTLLPRLFDNFVQGDDSTTRRFEGAGLGLSICRNLVEAMGGTIRVSSTPGQGSTFTIALPLPIADPQPVTEALAA